MVRLVAAGLLATALVRLDNLGYMPSNRVPPLRPSRARARMAA
jgi:hypothetical protein